MRIALCGIVKNEAPYLLDWIAWHRALGFTDFIIADNESDDGTTEILKQLEHAGVLRTFQIKSRYHTLPQIIAYGHAARIAKKIGVTWAAFFDADEFLMPATADLPISTYLNELPPTCGSLALNWATYGSAGHIRAHDMPVPYRFDARAPKSAGASLGAVANQHYKMIVRMDAFDGQVSNPHHFNVSSGFSQMAANGSVLDVYKVGLSKDVIWTPFRLNHYVIKSWAEYLYKKSARGTFNKNPKLSHEFFQRHDDHTDKETVPEWLKPEFERKRATLASLLHDITPFEQAVQKMLAFDPPPTNATPTTHVTRDTKRRVSKFRRNLRKVAMRIALLFISKKSPLDW